MLRQGCKQTPAVLNDKFMLVAGQLTLSMSSNAMAFVEPPLSARVCETDIQVVTENID